MNRGRIDINRHDARRQPATPSPLETAVRYELRSGRLAPWSNSIRITCQDGTVILEGKLPTFYLKQVLQTMVGKVPGVQQVNNEVQVDSSADCDPRTNQ